MCRRRPEKYDALNLIISLSCALSLCTRAGPFSREKRNLIAKQLVPGVKRGPVPGFFQAISFVRFQTFL